jgi:hypothetical protein
VRSLPVASNDERLIERHLEASGHGLSPNLSAETKEIQAKKNRRTANALVGNRSAHHPNTSLKCYRYANLLGFYIK